MLALSRSACRQWEVSGAREDGRTIRNIITQLIKLTGSCRQKAVLPVLLFDTTAELGSHRMCPPEISLPCSPSCEGDGMLVYPCGSNSPHFSFTCAGEMHCEELVPCLEKEVCLLSGRSVSGTFSPSSPGSWQEGSSSSPVLRGDRQLLCERSMSWWGSAHSLEVLLDKRAGSGYGVEKSQLGAVWKFGLGWECLCFLAKPQCYTSSCCRQSYLTGGVGSTGF